LVDRFEKKKSLLGVVDQVTVLHEHLQVQDSKPIFTVFEACTSSKVQCTGYFPIADGPALSVLHFIPRPGVRLSLATSYISVFFLEENMILTDERILVKELALTCQVGEIEKVLKI